MGQRAGSDPTAATSPPPGVQKPAFPSNRCSGAGRREGEKITFFFNLEEGRTQAGAVPNYPAVVRGAWVRSQLSPTTRARPGARWQGQTGAGVSIGSETASRSLLSLSRAVPGLSNHPPAAHQLCMHMDLGTSIWLNVYGDMKHFLFCSFL